MYYFFEERLIIIFNISIKFMANLLIINFKFLLLWKTIPAPYPILQACSFNFCKPKNIIDSNGCPDTISTYFDILTFLNFVNLTRHSPCSIFIIIFYSSMAQGFCFNLICIKIIASFNTTKTIKSITCQIRIPLR